MKKRLFSILLVTVMVLAAVVSLVACDNGDGAVALERLIITQNNKVVSEPFTLTRFLGDNDEFEIVWTSSNESALKLTKQESNYLATPIIGDKREEVTLTATVGKASKEFKVYVKGTDAYLFQSSYVFPQLNKKVSADFDLDTTYTVAGKTCNITWSIVEGSSVAKVEDNKCVITVDTTQNVNVRIKATFDFNGATADAEYPFIVGDVLSHDAEVAAWYAGIQDSIDVTGWVISVADYYPNRDSDTYKNVTVYMYDEDFCHSFYCYGIDFPFEDLDKLVPGAHVTATIPYKYYSGLIEGTGGSMTVDDTTPVNIDEHIYNFDVDASTDGLRYDKASAGIGGSITHTGSLVKLSGWKVASVATSKPAAGVDGTIFTLTKNGQSVTVAVSKRMAGCYVAKAGDTTWESLCNLVDTIKANDIVDVTGCLTYFNGWQILPRDVNDVVKATSESTVSDGANVVKAIADVKKALENVLGTIVSTSTSINLPTTSNGVTVSYKLSAKRDSITLDEATLQITPATAEKVYLQATFSVGSYSTDVFFEISAQELDEAGKIAFVKGTIDDTFPSKVEKNEVITLPVPEFEDVTVEWDSDQQWASINDGKLTITPPTADATLKLTATISCGSASPDTKEITIEVAGKPENVLARFTFGFNGATEHADGANSSNYTETDGNYTLTFTQSERVYSGARDAEGNSALKLGTSSATASFTFTVPSDVNSVKIYVAKYKTYDTYIKVNDGAQQALTKNSNNGEYDVITVDTTTNKTVTFATFDVPVQSGENTNHSVRCMINTIEFCK